LRLFVAHQIEGRTRLRVVVRPVEPLDLEDLAERLVGLPGIEAVDARPTGSLVIEHPEVEWEDIADALLASGAELVAAPQAAAGRNALTPLASGIHRGSDLLREATAGGVDLRTLSFVLLVVLGIRQMMRGQVMVPAISLLWWAFEVLLRRGVDSAGAPEAAD
jgi:hypothetical protein